MERYTSNSNLKPKVVHRIDLVYIYILSGPLAFSDSRILALGLGPETLEFRFGGPDSSPPDPWKPSFSFRRVDDFRPGLEGRVGDQFWHPWVSR